MNVSFVCHVVDPSDFELLTRGSRDFQKENYNRSLASGDSDTEEEHRKPCEFEEVVPLACFKKHSHVVPEAV